MLSARYMFCSVRDEVMVDVDTITAYIQDFLGGTVGNEYSNPPGAGKNHHPKSLIPQKTITVFDDSFEDLVIQSQEKCLFEKEF